MSFFDDTIGILGQSLAQSATSYLDNATGLNIGGTLNYLFTGQTEGGATLNGLIKSLNGGGGPIPGGSEALSLLQNTLNAQAAQLTTIGAQLTSMSKAIDNIYGEIAGIQSLLKQIDQEALYTSWQLQDNYIKNYLNQIDTTYIVYANYTASYQGRPSSSVATLCTNILNTNEGELTAANGINSYMVNDGSNKGALSLWAEMTRPLIEAGLLDYRQAVDQFKAYYIKLTWAQLRATNLVLEAYNYQDDHSSANSAWANYQSLILSQEDAFISNLVLIVSSGILGANSLHQESSGPTSYDFLAYHSSWQFHPDLSPHDPMTDAPYLSYYAVSPIFSDAEALLARLAVTGPDDRRIVVHMAYFGDVYKTAIDTVTITIEQLDSTFNAPLAPSNQSSIYGPMASPQAQQSMVDQVWYSDKTFYVKRLVYTNTAASPLPDGRYALTDLNGGNLPAMGIYGAENLAFQSDPVLGYKMQVNATQQFDFMNFGAYFGA